MGNRDGNSHLLTKGSTLTMKRFILAALALSISTAYAANCGNDKDVGNADCSPPSNGGGNQTPTTAASSISAAVAVAGAVSTSTALTSTSSTNTLTNGPSTSSVGNVTGGGATASAGSATVNIAAATQPGTVTVKNTPDAAVLIASPTAVCRISFGMGGSGPGIGLSFGSSTLDEGCDAREDARLLNNLGLYTEAIARLCAKAEMATALGAKCPVKATP